MGFDLEPTLHGVAGLAGPGVFGIPVLHIQALVQALVIIAHLSAEAFVFAISFYEVMDEVTFAISSPFARFAACRFVAHCIASLTTV